MSNTYNWSHRKLTDQQAVEVRKRYAAGGITQLQLANEYGVGDMVIGSIHKANGFEPPLGINLTIGSCGMRCSTRRKQ